MTIPPEAWSAPWTSSDTCARHQSQQAEIDLRDWLAGKPHEAFDALKAVVSPIFDRQVVFLEIGCGAGYNLEVLRSINHRVWYTGIDISPAMIEYARQKYSRPECVPHDCLPPLFYQQSADDIGMTDGEVDCVCLAAVIQHMPDYRPAIQEAVRVSRKHVILHRVQATRGETNEFIHEAYDTALPTREISERELLDFCESVGLKLVYAHRWGNLSVAFNGSYLFEKL